MASSTMPACYSPPGAPAPLTNLPLPLPVHLPAPAPACLQGGKLKYKLDGLKWTSELTEAGDDGGQGPPETGMILF